MDSKIVTKNPFVLNMCWSRNTPPPLDKQARKGLGEQWFSDTHEPNVWWCGVGTYGDF